MKRTGTFSFLPELSSAELRRQVEHLVARGWNPAIEHVEPEHAVRRYWYLWKLPMFGEKQVEKILAEAAECHRANPAHHVRLIGYDNKRQSVGASLVVYAGTAG